MSHYSSFLLLILLYRLGTSGCSFNTTLLSTPYPDKMLTSHTHADETTANSISWMLFELAKDLNLQRRVREEIRLVKEEGARKGEAELTTAQRDQMVLLEAVTKVGLPRVFDLQ